ncbi:MAG TPA: transposase [Tepidisphaeraceae bacterium]|jgi:putative transposase
MPRRARAALGGLVYHVLNRGNERRTIFHKRGDARAFIQLMAEAKQQVPVRLLAFCLMGNHWHLVLWPAHGCDSDLSDFMAWLTNAHVRRYRKHYNNDGAGHVYQGRFKSFPVQGGGPGEANVHLLRTIRYVEANARRAGLVERAIDWPWSSLAWHAQGNPGGLLDSPSTAPITGTNSSRKSSPPPNWSKSAAAPTAVGHTDTTVGSGKPPGP